MSSIRLFILGALAERGSMHGHQLRLLAEQEHIDEWTDITVGALYGAIKRLASEGLIEEVRQEREGAYPERQVYAITQAGQVSLTSIRLSSLREIVLKPDPFDLAMSRLDPAKLEDVDGLLSTRLETLKSMLADAIAHTAAIRKWLTLGESIVMQHRVERLKSEITWHEMLYAKLPEIIADESARKDH